MSNKIRRHHTVELAELQQFLAAEEITFAASSRENKRLLVSAGSHNIRVTVGGKEVYHGTQPFSAVEAYNAITKRWIDPAKDFKL